MSDQATEDVPLILLEVAAGESEAHRSTLQDHRPELGRLDARLLEQFPPGGPFWRLTGVDPSTRQVPPRGARRLRRVGRVEHQDPVEPIEQEDARDRPSNDNL